MKYAFDSEESLTMETPEKTESKISRSVRLPKQIDDLILQAMDATGCDRSEIMVACCSEENLRGVVDAILRRRHDAHGIWKQLTKGRKPHTGN